MVIPVTVQLIQRWRYSIWKTILNKRFKFKFYDTDNPMSQILVSYILFSYLKPTDLHQKVVLLETTGQLNQLMRYH
jgi:hypothetical protein